MQTAKRRGCVATIAMVSMLAVAVVYGVALLISPWAFHIGGRWTPFLCWSGVGQLHTKHGDYPLYVLISPSPHFSRLRLDGFRPIGGLRGTARICTAPGVSQYMLLGGTIYGNWRTTDNSLLEFRLVEYRYINLGQRQGFFDLYGRWHGEQLVMNDRGRWSGTFNSGLRIEKASVAFEPASYAMFKAACAGMTSTPAKAPAGP